LQGNWWISNTADQKWLLASDPCDEFRGWGAVHCFCRWARKTLVMPLHQSTRAEYFNALTADISAIFSFFSGNWSKTSSRRRRKTASK